MASVPRKLAFRVLAELLDGHARAVDHRTTDSVRRRGDQAVEGSIGKAALRAKHNDRMRESSRVLAQWTARPDRFKGADVDAELLGWLCAWAAGHGAAKAEIIRAAPPETLDGVDWSVFPEVVWAAITGGA